MHFLLSPTFWIVLLLAYALVDQLLFWAAPPWAHKLNLHGKRRQAMRLLERVVALPSLTGDRAKILSRFHLALWHLHEKEYVQAQAQYQKRLRHRLPPGLEAGVRQYLAECQEALGDERAAEQQRSRAESVTVGKQDIGSLFAEGKRLRQQGRHADACVVFERALARVPAGRSDLRVQLLTSLMLAAFDAGRTAQTAQCAESAIAAGAEGVILIVTHRMAAVAFGDMGDLARAEPHCRRSYELAEAAGQRDQAAQSLAYLGNLQRKRGALADAVQTCERAVAMGTGDPRVVQIIRAECLRDLGRFDEARDVFLAARDSPAYAQPSAERRSQATLALGLSWLAAEMGDGKIAWDRLQEATVELSREDKLRLWCEATAAWILALLGRGDQARQKIAWAEEHLQPFAQDRTTLLGTLSALGRAASHLGDDQRSRALWERYLAAEPDLISQPKGLYFLGETHWRMGEREAARESWQQAVGLSLDTHYSRLAAERLAETA